MNTAIPAPFGGVLTRESVVLWAVALVRSPREFFRNMAREGGYRTPILYALVWQAVAGVVWVLVSFLRPEAMPMGPVGKVFWVLFGPGVILVVGFVISAVLFVIWHLMGSPFGYQTAFRVWAFGMPLSAVGALLTLGTPILPVVVVVYRFYVLVMASIEGHGIRPRLAWTVWSVILAMLLLIQVVSMGTGLRAASPSDPLRPAVGGPALPGSGGR